MRHGLTEFSQEDEVRGTSIDPFGDFVWVGPERGVPWWTWC